MIGLNKNFIAQIVQTNLFWGQKLLNKGHKRAKNDEKWLVYHYFLEVLTELAGYSTKYVRLL
jgi:hypothetical protein